MVTGKDVEQLIIKFPDPVFGLEDRIFNRTSSHVIGYCSSNGDPQLCFKYSVRRVGSNGHW